MNRNDTDFKTSVLIVEDEKIIALDLEMILTELGYNVCGILEKGESVLDFVRKNNPDIILMDITLKDNMNGIEATTELFNNNYDIPVIFNSAEINKERLAKIKLPNTYGFLIKPIREDSLYSMIEIALDKNRLEREIKNKNKELVKYQKLTENSYTILTILDRNGRLITESVEATKKILGYERNERAGEDVFDYIHPYDKKYVREQFNHILKTKNGFTKAKFRNRHKNGSWVYLESSAKNMLDDPDINGILVNSRDITEKKQAEKDLKESKELFKGITKQIPGAVYQFKKNKDGKYQIPYMSKSAEKLFERPVEQLMDESFLFSDVHEEDKPYLFKTIEKSFNDFSPWFCEFRLIIEGKTKWIRGNSIPEKQADGSVVWNGILYDITKEKSIQQALQESEANLKAIFNNTQQLFIMISSDLKIISINETAKKYYKNLMNIDVNPGHDMLSLIYHEHLEGFKNNIKKALKGEYINTVKSLPVNNDKYYFNFSYNPVFEKGKEKIDKVVFSVLDITEQKRAEQALIESEARLKRAERIAHLGSWEMDFATGDAVWSDEFFRICGYEPQKFKPNSEIGMTLIHPDDRERAANAVGKSVIEGKPYVIEKRIVRPNGEIRHVYSQGEIEKDKDGNPVKLIGSFLDITHLKNTEEKLKEYTQKLEISNNELEGFANVIAHDLKNPLNVIISGLKLIQRNNYCKEEISEINNSLIKKTQYLINQVDDMLKYSKISWDADSFKNIKLVHIINYTIDNLNGMIENRNAQITFNNVNIEIFADKTLMLSLFQNLISNSLKYSLNKPKIVVSVNEKDTDWLISVKDNGIGINEKDKDKIFRMMYRVKSVKKDYEGTGIGLASCRKIVEIHGGKIWVESVPGEGSTFFFTIPKKLS